MEGNPKPFQYLLGTVASDFGRAWAFRQAWAPLSEDEWLARLPIRTYPSHGQRDTEDLRQYFDSDVEVVRIGAIIFSARRAEVYQKYIDMCFRLAFDDPSPVVRGFAWEAIGDAWSHEPPCEKLRSLMRRIVRERLYSRLPIEAEIGPTVWLDGVHRLKWRKLWQAERARMLESDIVELAPSEIATRLLKEPESAWQYLRHSNPELRIAALRVARERGLRDPKFSASALQLARSDPDPRVRQIAISSCVEWNSRDANREIMKTLAEIALDESEMPRLRLEAYDGLVKIEGRPFEEWPRRNAQSGRFVFPDDVDWGFVNRCLGKSTSC